MKVVLDRSGCVSCGSCWDSCPAFFEKNPDDSFSWIKEEFRVTGNIAEGVAPGDLAACVKDAADLCPVQVIAIEDS